MNMQIPLTSEGFKKLDHDDEAWTPTKGEHNWKNNGQTSVPIPHGPCP